MRKGKAHVQLEVGSEVRYGNYLPVVLVPVSSSAEQTTRAGAADNSSWKSGKSQVEAFHLDLVPA